MAGPEDVKKELKARRNAKGENRVPPAAAVIVAALAYALLPASLLVGPRYVIPGIDSRCSWRSSRRIPGG